MHEACPKGGLPAQPSTRGGGHLVYAQMPDQARGGGDSVNLSLSTELAGRQRQWPSLGHPWREESDLGGIFPGHVVGLPVTLLHV